MITLQNVSYKINDQYILNNINLTVKLGERLAIIGPSGAGKTTLLKIIAQLLEPTTGRVTNNHSIGFMFQGHTLFPWRNVIDNIIFPSQVSGISQKNYYKDAMTIIDRLGLLSHKNKQINQLSGGQMQRVALARTLMTKPRVLLLDEAFSNLDQDTAKHIQQDILDYVSNSSTILIFISHNQTEVAHMANNVFNLDYLKDSVSGYYDYQIKSLIAV